MDVYITTELRVTVVTHVFMLLVSQAIFVKMHSAYAAVLRGQRVTLCLHISPEIFSGCLAVFQLERLSLVSTLLRSAICPKKQN